MWPVFALVCEVYGVKPENAIRHSRLQELVFARMAFCAIMNKNKWKLQQIGRFLSGRDHSSMSNAMRRHRELTQNKYDLDNPYAVKYRACVDLLKTIKETYRNPEGMQVARARATKPHPYIYAGYSVKVLEKM